MNQDNKKIKTLILSSVIFLLTIIGVTYAYFSIRISGNEQASSITVLAATLSLSYVDGDTINGVDISPGWTDSKTFTITNTGTVTEYYDIQLKEVFSTVIKDELVYTLTSNGSVNINIDRIVPTNDAALATKISIASGATHTYTLTLKFKEMGYLQNYNQSSSFTGKIQLISPYKYTNNVATDLTLKQRVLLDNTSYSAEAASKYVSSASGIDYGKVSGFEYPTYKKVTDIVSLTSDNNNKKYIGTGFTYDNGTFRPTINTVSNQLYTSIL